MTVRRAAVVEQSLIAKGMTAEDNHHTMFRMQVDGTTTVVTRISHGAREIDEHLGNLMAKQCFLFLKEFWDLVDCPLSNEDWVTKIRTRAVDGKNPFLGF